MGFEPALFELGLWSNVYDLNQMAT